MCAIEEININIYITIILINVARVCLGLGKNEIKENGGQKWGLKGI